MANYIDPKVFRPIVMDGPSIYTAKKRFPQQDVHHNSQVRMHMDREKRLESNYQAQHMKNIERHYSPSHEEQISSPERFKPAFAAGVRGLALETDAEESYVYQSRNQQMSRDGSNANLAQMPRHSSLAPKPTGPSMASPNPYHDKGAHLNKSRRRILNDYVRPAAVFSHSGSQVLANKNLHQNLNSKFGPIPNDNHNYIGAPIDQEQMHQAQLQMQNNSQRQSQVSLEDYQKFMDSQNQQDKAATQEPNPDFVFINKQEEEQQAFQPKHEMSYDQPQGSQMMNQQSNNNSPAPAQHPYHNRNASEQAPQLHNQNQLVNFGSPAPKKDIADAYFSRVRQAEQRVASQRRDEQSRLSQSLPLSVSAERQLQENPRQYGNPAVNQYQHQQDQVKREYRNTLERQIHDRNSIINSLKSIQKNYGHKLDNNTSTVQGQKVRAQAHQQNVGNLPGHQMPIPTLSQTSAHPQQYHQQHLGGGHRAQMPPRDNLGAMAAQYGDLAFQSKTIQPANQSNSHLDFRNHYV